MTGESQTLETETEQELLRRAKRGDFEAFQKIVEQLQPRVYGLTFRMLRQAQDAEDATQQTFVSLIEHLHEFREESTLATWVLRIASNHALKILRKKRTVTMLQMSALAKEDSYGELPHPEFIAPWSQPPDEIIQREETKAAIDKALAELDDKYRLVFILRDIEGLSVRETAQLLELTESTVKVRLLRARLALRELLTRQFGDAEQAIIPDHKHS